MAKYISLFLLFVCLTVEVHGQDTTMQFLNKNWQVVTETEAVFIRQIEKQGNFSYKVSETDVAGNRVLVGEYNSIDPFIEHGKFEFYDVKSDTLFAIGQYTDGVMTGEWEYYRDKRCKPVLTKLNFDIEFGKIPEEDNEGNPNYKWIVEDPPQFKADNGETGDDKLLSFLARDIRCPAMATIRNVQDEKVLFKLIVTKDGTPANLEMVRGSHKDYEKELERVLENSNWKAGTQRGIPQNVEKIADAYFSMDSLAHVTQLTQSNSEISKIVQAILDQPALAMFVYEDSTVAWGNPWLVSIKDLTITDRLTFLEQRVRFYNEEGNALSGTITLGIDGTRNTYKVSAWLELLVPTVGRRTHANMLWLRCKVKSRKGTLKISKIKTVRLHQRTSQP